MKFINIFESFIDVWNIHNVLSEAFVKPTPENNKKLWKEWSAGTGDSYALKRAPIIPTKGMYNVKWHDRDSFVSNTDAVFQPTKSPDRQPDKQTKGSTYWYTKEGVYRKSDHWGKDINTSNWFLGNQKQTESSYHWKGGIQTGFANWFNFRTNFRMLTREEKLENAKKQYAGKDVEVRDGYIMFNDNGNWQKIRGDAHYESESPSKGV